jgi:hypothetical protein
MLFKGKVMSISPISEVGQKWTKLQNVVVSDEKPEFPNSLAITFFEKGFHQVEKLNVGDLVEVDFNHTASEGAEGKFFNNLTGWKVNVLQAAEVETEAKFGEEEAEDESLPF